MTDQVVTEQQQDAGVAAGASAATTETPPSSFDATLQSEIDKLFDASERTEQRQDKANGQDRAPNGQFQARDGQSQQGDGQAQQQELQDQVPEPPTSWSSLKAHWATLSPEARQALVAEHDKVQQSLTEHGERLKGYESLERILGPRREALKANFQSVDTAVEQLFALSDFAGRDFPGFVRWMCEQRGVDPKSLIEQVAAQPTTDPIVAALQRKVADLEKDASQRGQAEEQDLERRAAQAIEAFKTAKDKDGSLLHPHFDAVSQAMAPLLRSGIEPERAYKMAVAADDKLQARIAADAETARKAKEAEDAKNKANQARRAANSDLRSGSGASSANRASLDETLRAEIAKRVA